MSTSSVLYPFSYDSVIYAAQKGDIKNADEQMRTIVVNSPDDADVLYDAGVLAHQLNNANQAAAYFARSANCAHDDKDLCFRAHFNAGNAYVDTKDLKAALLEYDAALKIDPDNEYARHNHDKVKQMLQEQEQKQDQQNDKNDQQDDKDKEQDQQDKKDQKNDQNQSGNENDQQQDQDNSSENGSDQKSDQQSKGDKGESSKKDSNREQGKQQGDADKHDQNPGKKKERDGNQGLDDKSQDTQDKREPQQSKQHGKTPEQEKTNDKNSIASQGEQGQASPEADQTEIDKCAEKINDPWLLGILNEQEAHDKEVNKKLMEARIRQHGGKNGQNCW